MLRKLQSVNKYMRVFASPLDVIKFRKIYKSTIDGEPVLLRMKESDYGILCRLNTTDAQVLWDVFYRKYTISPIKLPDDATILDQM